MLECLLHFVSEQMLITGVNIHDKVNGVSSEGREMCSVGRVSSEKQYL
jgi:hypothetical protein